MLRVVAEDAARHELAFTPEEICRRGAERMLALALEAEVDAYLERHREARDERGRASSSATAAPGQGPWPPGPVPSR